MVKRYRIYGIVQGVGFRPFIKRLADSCEIKGIVCNYGPFVEVTAKGEEETLAAFRQAVVSEAPERASVMKIEELDGEDNDSDFNDFTIVESGKTAGEIFIPPDLAICDECKKELLDPADRRFHHPFINCTQCGPRLTIIENLPYDRERTGMKMFPMCKKCGKEYTDKLSRRMDAQPVCCNACGPEYYVLYDKDNVRGDAALQKAAGILKSGGILAVKGIGGFHLACDAKDNDAVKTLRERKKRPAKPFAVMMKDIETVKKYCLLTSAQERELKGPAAPIVLLEKKTDAEFLAADVAPGNPALGVMLPYAPVQILLFEYSGLDVLVMTSGNISGAPICADDEEALKVLAGFSDCILSNNRPILTRADDSVMDFLDGRPYMIRRSRGFAPLPVRVKVPDVMQNPGKGGSPYQFASSEDNTGRKTVLAIGGELKNTFCIGIGDLFYPSSFIGDLDDIRAVEVLEETATRFMDMLQIPDRRPDVIVCDMHPGYRSTELAERLADKTGAELMKVQHHYAHILSCMAENDCMDKVIGISFDGTGYGTDGSIWGGEILLCDADGFERKANITPFDHIGGDTASKEGWMIAVSMLCAPMDNEIPDGNAAAKNADFDVSVEASVSALFEEKVSPDLLKMHLALVKNRAGAVKSTSAGRLFDAVSAVLGFCCSSTFEGEAAMKLEFAAEAYAKRDAELQEYQQYTGEISSTHAKATSTDKNCNDPSKECESDHVVNYIDTISIFRRIFEDTLAGKLSKDMLAYAFHDMLATETARATVRISGESGIKTVALSGGCFQNKLFTALLKKKLEAFGIKVLTHSIIPANDGGIALGQAVAGVNCRCDLKML